MNAVEKARSLNAEPFSGCLDRTRVAGLLDARPLMFSDTRVYVAREHLQRMAEFVAAMERVAALPGWQERALSDAPDSARHLTGARGVFFGYDFHIVDDGPKLIEINTNAGGGFLNALLLQAQRGAREGLPDGAALERCYLEMFETEWRGAGRAGRPQRIAIVDDEPQDQYLNGDFDLCAALLERHGIEAIICAPQQLRCDSDGLYLGEQRIDLVYNRLTDFFFEQPAHAALRQAWMSDAAVVTPHPRAYALYADKRNLIWLGDEAWLASIGVDETTRALLRQVVPSTERVSVQNAEDIHARRKQLFFKPATGFGGKAAYRGQNVTTRVFAEIVAGDYVAQAVVPPPMRTVMVDGEPAQLKFDLRCYAYAGAVQLTAARVWQGQMTNFRTRGGGFTPVVEVSR